MDTEEMFDIDSILSDIDASPQPGESLPGLLRLPVGQPVQRESTRYIIVPSRLGTKVYKAIDADTWLRKLADA